MTVSPAPPAPPAPPRMIEVNWTDYPRTIDGPGKATAQGYTVHSVATDLPNYDGKQAVWADHTWYVGDGTAPKSTLVIKTAFDEVPPHHGGELARAVALLERRVDQSGVEKLEPTPRPRRADPLPGQAYVRIWNDWNDRFPRDGALRTRIIDNFNADPKLRAMVAAARKVHNLTIPGFPDNGRRARPER